MFECFVVGCYFARGSFGLAGFASFFNNQIVIKRSLIIGRHINNGNLGFGIVIRVVRKRGHGAFLSRQPFSFGGCGGLLFPVAMFFFVIVILVSISCRIQRLGRLAAHLGFGVALR